MIYFIYPFLLGSVGGGDQLGARAFVDTHRVNPRQRMDEAADTERSMYSTPPYVVRMFGVLVRSMYVMLCAGHIWDYGR